MIYRPRCDWKILLIWILTIVVLVWYLNQKSIVESQFRKFEKKLSMKIEQGGQKTMQTYNRSVPVRIIIKYNMIE